MNGPDLAAAATEAESLLGLLQRERQALQAGAGESLAQLSRSKAQILVRLGAILPALRQPTGDPQQRLALRQLIQRCAAETQVNEALLHARAARSRRALQAMQGTPVNYDGRGNSRYGLAGTLRGAA
jgi:flagellar biosynthesis/type III secretory pathway chaperone